MKPTNLEWEDVIQFEEVKGYGKSIWKNEDKYYLFLEEGTVASWLAVYDLPQELFPCRFYVRYQQRHGLPKSDLLYRLP